MWEKERGGLFQLFFHMQMFGTTVSVVKVMRIWMLLAGRGDTRAAGVKSDRLSGDQEARFCAS